MDEDDNGKVRLERVKATQLFFENGARMYKPWRPMGFLDLKSL